MVEQCGKAAVKELNVNKFDPQHYLKNKASINLLKILDALSELSDEEELPVVNLVMVVARYFDVDVMPLEVESDKP